MRKLAVFALFAAAIFAACGGHSSSSLPATNPSPATQSTTAPLGSSPASVTFPAIASGAAGTVGLPATTSGSATATLVLQSTLPTGVAAPSSLHARGPKTLGGTVTALAYVTLTVSASVSISQSPSFTFTFPAGALAGTGYLAFFDPTNASAGWQQVAGPVSASGTSIAFSATTLSPTVTLAANTTYVFAIVVSASTLPVATPADCPAYTPATNGIPLNITDDAGIAGAQLLVYPTDATTSTFLSADGTFDSSVPVPLPAACFSTTTGSAGTKPLLIPNGVKGGRVYFAYAPYTAGTTTAPNPMSGGNTSGPAGTGGGMVVTFPWDFIEYGTNQNGTTVDTSQVVALGLPLELSTGATPLPATTPGPIPTAPPAGASPAPCPTNGPNPGYVGVTTCNFANIFYAIENTPNYNANVIAAAFPSGSGSTLDLRVISPGESAQITSFQWNFFNLASYIPSPLPPNCPSPATFGYLSCVMASYQQQGRIFTSVIPGAGPVKASATPGPDFVTGDYYCVTSDGTQNFIFTDIGSSSTATCSSPPNANVSPNPFHMNVYNLIEGVPPGPDNNNQPTCKPAILLQQPWGLANVDNTVEATQGGFGATGHLFANDDAFGLWKGLIADLVYGTAMSTTQVHPIGAVTPPPASLGELFKDPLYDQYDYILHEYFDNGLTYGLAYDDLYGLESGVNWNLGDSIDVRINAIPTAASAIVPPNPQAVPTPCPALTPGVGSF